MTSEVDPKRSHFKSHGVERLRSMAVNPPLCHFSRPTCRGFSQEVHRASCEKFGTQNSIRRRKASGGRVVAGHEKTNSIHQPRRGAYPGRGIAMPRGAFQFHGGTCNEA
ncbi:protein of unknown function [Denitratisoma oestradiolicum]|uniref:Uncharacterized protein n=1 Tax=Denitratisoma oestradiolicum TaxID=311182 RepID=A0A6S6YN39_9PROT|nr:protein of unknown function [Denitratisoma oestradiolicum]